MELAIFQTTLPRLWLVPQELRELAISEKFARTRRAAQGVIAITLCHPIFSLTLLKNALRVDHQSGLSFIVGEDLVVCDILGHPVFY